MKVTVNIPADAPTGDRYATVWAQPAVPGGGGVVSTSRVGVRMDVRVGPGAGTTADFTIDGLTAERDAAGQAVVVADVRNTGGWATEVGGELTLTDGPAGRTLGPLYADEVVVAAGAGAKVRFRLPDSAELPAGPWRAHVALESGAVEREHDGEITFPAPDSGGNGSLGSLGSSDAGSSSSPLMWVGIAGAAAAAIGAIGWTVLQQQNPPGFAELRCAGPARRERGSRTDSCDDGHGRGRLCVTRNLLTSRVRRCPLRLRRRSPASPLSSPSRMPRTARRARWSKRSPGVSSRPSRSVPRPTRSPRSSGPELPEGVGEAVPVERAEVFLRYRDLVLEHKDALMDMAQAETGKSRASAQEEVLDIAMTSRYYARLAPKLLRPKRVQGMLPGLTRPSSGTTRRASSGSSRRGTTR